MAVRRQCNRYKTEPWGTDYKEVLKRAKAFFKDETFYITKYNTVYCSFRPSFRFKDPDDAVYYKKVGHKWIEQSKEDLQRS